MFKTVEEMGELGAELKDDSIIMDSKIDTIFKLFLKF